MIEVRPGFDAALLREIVGAGSARAMIAHGLAIYVALELVDMRLGAEWLGASTLARTDPT